MVRNFKIAGLVGLLILGFISGWGQEKNIPREKIYTHLSEKCLFPGEHLWLTVFVSNYSDLPGKQISNLAYVEFVDYRNTSLIRKKIVLKNGIGVCSLEMPDTLSTGIYTVLVYTKWSKNFGEECYNRTKVLVFNPGSPQSESIQNFELASNLQSKSEKNSVAIRTNKTIYSTREKVMLELDFGNSDFNQANFSVSVRKKEPDQICELTREEPVSVSANPKKITFYPDYKGFLLSGRILNKINNSPVSEEEIILSFPGNYTEIKYAKTNQNGEFDFLLEPVTGELDLVFNLPSADCMVNLNDPFINEFNQVIVQKKLVFEDATVQYMKDRFVRFQLMKRFGQTNFENIGKNEKTEDVDFFGKAYQILKFEDYRRLDSLSEYFYELVPTVHFSNKQGEQQLYITNPDTDFKLGDNPVVFIDGVYYPGLNELAELDHKLVKQISVIPKVYYYRDKIYDGIVSIKTKEGSFNQVKQLDNMVRMLYPVGDICPSFKIFNPTETDHFQHIPDIRSLLHWESNLLFEKYKPGKISFHTSDVTGEFIISIAGLTDSGEFVLNQKTISVVSE